MKKVEEQQQLHNMNNTNRNTHTYIAKTGSWIYPFYFSCKDMLHHSYNIFVLFFSHTYTQRCTYIYQTIFDDDDFSKDKFCDNISSRLVKVDARN